MAAQGTFGLTLLTGVYAALSPWIVGFDGTSRLAFTNFIVGVVVAVLALGFASALDRTHGMSFPRGSCPVCHRHPAWPGRT